MLLTFEFKTVEEAQAFLLKNFTNQTADNMALSAQPPISFPPGAFEQAAKDSEPMATPTKKPGRPKKAVEKHVPADPAPGTVLEKPEPFKQYTIDDCRTALSHLFDKKGREAAKRALEGYQVARIGELTAPVYAQFIETCADLSK